MVHCVVLNDFYLILVVKLLAQKASVKRVELLESGVRW